MKASPFSLSDLLRANPIVVTGTGAFGATGHSVASLWNAAISGHSTAAWRQFDAGITPSRFAVCTAPDPDISQPDLRPARRLDRCVQMAFVAAHKALNDARIANVYPPERVGIAVGSSRGPVDKQTDTVVLLNSPKFAPSLVSQASFASLSGALAQSLKLKGPGGTISTACASAAFAIIYAAEQIALGKADAMLAGGAEASLHPVILRQLHSAGVLGFHEEARLTCRPFDIDRNGLVLGEGSGFLVLERMDQALARGAVPHAILSGWANANEASGRVGVRNDGAGLTLIMRQALQMAELEPGDIAYINAHGTGTRGNDAAEARAIAELFAGESPPFCSSTKPVTGHCLGATAALEAIVCIEALRHQQVPPSINCLVRDPHCQVNLPAASRPHPGLKVAMSNSMGFWGYQATLVFEKYFPDTVCG